jgi:acyl-coenzyme A thioesterase PaaI-like protein
MSPVPLQDQFAAKSICFGCGPANPAGLHVQSIPEGDDVVCHWTPAAHHHAFPGVLNGGIVGAILDCHCNWTGAYHLMQRDQLAAPPCTVTADYTVTLKRPTPMDCQLEIRARAVASDGPKVIVEGTLSGNGKITATFRGTFVAVNSGHPAWHRW